MAHVRAAVRWWGRGAGMGVGGGGEAAVSAPAAEKEAAGKKDAEEGSGWTMKEKLIAAVVLVWVLGSAMSGVLLHSHFRHAALRKAEEGLVSMCEERARMLQDQFAVSVNHVHALAILVATFHYEKHPPALDQVRSASLRTQREPSSSCGCGFCLPATTTAAPFLLVEYLWARSLAFCSARAVNCVSRRLWESLLFLPLP